MSGAQSQWGEKELQPQPEDGNQMTMANTQHVSFDVKALVAHRHPLSNASVAVPESVPHRYTIRVDPDTGVMYMRHRDRIVARHECGYDGDAEDDGSPVESRVEIVSMTIVEHNGIMGQLVNERDPVTVTPIAGSMRVEATPVRRKRHTIDANLDGFHVHAISSPTFGRSPTDVTSATTIENVKREFGFDVIVFVTSDRDERRAAMAPRVYVGHLSTPLQRCEPVEGDALRALLDADDDDTTTTFREAAFGPDRRFVIHRQGNRYWLARRPPGDDVNEPVDENLFFDLYWNPKGVQVSRFDAHRDFVVVTTV